MELKQHLEDDAKEDQPKLPEQPLQIHHQKRDGNGCFCSWDKVT
jgi:hypothetical protein